MKDLHQLIAAIVDRLLRERAAGAGGRPHGDDRGNPGVRAALDRLEDHGRFEADFADYTAFKRKYAHRRAKAFRRLHGGIRQADRPPIRPAVFFVAAAMLLLAVSVSLLIRMRDYDLLPAREPLTLARAKSIVPGRTRATLTIDGGQAIALDSSAGSLVIDGRVVYENGEPVDGALLSAGGAASLTVATPRGGEYALRLADGTRVFLNAESRLTYPVRFADSARTVYLTGEAYFEVARDAARPFRVITGKNAINVLGTQFNVKAYPEESASYVTLVEGLVRVTGGDDRDMYLKPGLQSISTAAGTHVRAVNVGDYVAWRSGEFSFADVNLATAMAELARWYDYEVEVEPSAGAVRIWGTVSRYDTFDKVLEIIKLVDRELKIHLTGRRIIMSK